MFRICNVFERILVEVYAEKAVSLDLAKSISRQHRQWTEELPRMLMDDGLEQSDADQGSGLSPRNFGLSRRHGSSVVTMAYYYSIVLLTRPFLTFRVRHCSNDYARGADKGSTNAALITYSDACVNSAVKGIDSAHEYVFDMETPKRQPLVVNRVFILALCLGLASLSHSTLQEWHIEASMDRAIKILARLGQLNAQATRYASICRQLKEAAAIYAAGKDDSLLQENDEKIRIILGDIGSSTRAPYSGEASTADEVDVRERAAWSTSTHGARQQMTPPAFDFSTIEKESMLSTSGNLPGYVPGLHYHHQHYEPDVDNATHSSFAGADMESMTGLFLEQDVPLFPLASCVSPDSYFGPVNI
jgi:hypothetical protein